MARCSQVPGAMTHQRWQRVALLLVLGYEGSGALIGGSLLIAAPDGHYMDMPVDIMHGIFRDFSVPGVILFLLGALNAGAFVSVLRKTRQAWIASALAIGGMAIWFVVEIVILRQLHWLHAMWGLPVILGGIAATSLVPFSTRQG